MSRRKRIAIVGYDKVAPLLQGGGHGHVFKRVDGFMANCGGPCFCESCREDLELKLQLDRPERQRQCDAWNVLNPVGSAVTFTLDNGDQRQTTTRSDAWVTDSAEPVVLLEVISGAQGLSRIERVAP